MGAPTTTSQQGGKGDKPEGDLRSRVHMRLLGSIDLNQARQMPQEQLRK